MRKLKLKMRRFARFARCALYLVLLLALGISFGRGEGLLVPFSSSLQMCLCIGLAVLSSGDPSGLLALESSPDTSSAGVRRALADGELRRTSCRMRATVRTSPFCAVVQSTSATGGALGTALGLFVEGCT